MSDKFCTFLIMGVAASGKTTIAEKLAKKINGFLVIAITRFPGTCGSHVGA